MKIRSSRLAAIAAGALFALCTGGAFAQSDVAPRAPELRIYSFGEISMSGYEVVSRLWADSWRSSLWIPTFPTREQALAALQTEAARRGADALLNVNCFDQGRWKWATSQDPAFLCYGIAIRVLAKQG